MVACHNALLVKSAVIDTAVLPRVTFRLRRWANDTAVDGPESQELATGSRIELCDGDTIPGSMPFELSLCDENCSVEATAGKP